MIDLNYNLGAAIILVSATGYVSHWLNIKFLNFGIVRWLYYLGALVHELSHAIVAALTGAKITELEIVSRQPHVTHTRSKIPFLGQVLISLAPIAGGLLWLWLINQYLFANSFAFVLPQSLIGIIVSAIQIVQSLDFSWPSLILVLLILNVGAMIGPSTRDLKNIWPALIILLFISSVSLTPYLYAAVALILFNIILQLIFILLKWSISLLHKR
ncbi:MAG: M50 family metallopeptidase [Candidatus Komeilibacteria bacterium]|nr:M50 family metallopeptidase [Candidatus Komeilibacteria bacterium]